MKKIIFCLLMIFSLTVGANEYDYKITKVIDGDTVEIEVDFLPVELGNRLPVRIYGIDSPEIFGKCIDEVTKAKEARKYMMSLIGSDYKIIIKGRDKYFRIVGDIVTPKGVVSDLMIEGGHAVTYDARKKQSWCN